MGGVCHRPFDVSRTTRLVVAAPRLTVHATHQGPRPDQGRGGGPKRGHLKTVASHTMGFVNEATWDRALRIVVGGGMLFVGWSGEIPGVWGLGLKLFGLFPLFSGLLGWDPVYTLLGFRTNKKS
jgi:hypothetical protein